MKGHLSLDKEMENSEAREAHYKFSPVRTSMRRAVGFGTAAQHRSRVRHANFVCRVYCRRVNICTSLPNCYTHIPAPKKTQT